MAGLKVVKFTGFLKNKPLAHTKLYVQRAKTMAHDLNKHDIAHQANTDDQYYIIA